MIFSAIPDPDTRTKRYYHVGELFPTMLSLLFKYFQPTTTTNDTLHWNNIVITIAVDRILPFHTIEQKKSPSVFPA